MIKDQTNIYTTIIASILVGISFGIFYIYNQNVTRQNMINSINSFFLNLNQTISTLNSSYNSYYIYITPPVKPYTIITTNNTTIFIFNTINYNITLPIKIIIYNPYGNETNKIISYSGFYIAKSQSGFIISFNIFTVQEAILNVTVFKPVPIGPPIPYPIQNQTNTTNISNQTNCWEEGTCWFWGDVGADPQYWFSDWADGYPYNPHGINYLPPILNQNTCGSCYAFATANTISSDYNIFKNITYSQDPLMLSISYLVYETTIKENKCGCEGGTYLDTFPVVQNGTPYYYIDLGKYDPYNPLTYEYDYCVNGYYNYNPKTGEPCPANPTFSNEGILKINNYLVLPYDYADPQAINDIQSLIRHMVVWVGIVEMYHAMALVGYIDNYSWCLDQCMYAAEISYIEISNQYNFSAYCQMTFGPWSGGCWIFENQWGLRTGIYPFPGELPEPVTVVNGFTIVPYYGSYYSADWDIVYPTGYPSDRSSTSN